MGRASERPFERIESAIRELPGWLAGQSGSELGAAIIKGREVVDRMEAVNGEATRRFEKTGGYRADGALGMTPWLRTHGKLSAGAAAEHVETARQRLAAALGEVCRRGRSGQGSEVGHANGAGPRPQRVITAAADTLAGIEGAPAGRLEWGGTVPAETVRRLACDSAITRITGLGELEWEISHSSRTIPPATRRALVARDHHCVFPGCDRPAPWCDGHHLIFWADGGPTKLENLGLVCVPHHRKVHEEGWTLKRKDDRWVATPPPLKVAQRARSA